MSIGFNAIPVDIRTPGQFIEFDSSRAVGGLSAQPHRALLVGYRQTASPAKAGELTQILSVDAADVAFGAGSQIAAMARRFKAANPRTELHAIAVDNADASTPATGTFTVVGSVTASGALPLYVAGQSVPVKVTQGDDAPAVAAAIVAAINARASLPISATQGTDSSTHIVTMTAKWNGPSGNEIDISPALNGETFPVPGLDLELTGFTGGATDDDLEDVVAALGDTQFHTVACGLTSADALTTLTTELERRWGPMVMAEGHAFVARSGSFGTMSSAGSVLNSRHLSLMGSGYSPTPPWEWAAVVAAVDAAEPDPARPRQTLALPGVRPPSRLPLTRDERDLLLRAGVATFTTGDDGVCRIERLITTYQTSPVGVADPSFLDIETLRTLAFLRYDLRNSIALRYPRHKLASDDARFGPGQPVVTPGSLRTHILVRFGLWESAGLVEGFEQFKAELVVERSASDPNRIDAVIPPDLMNQFRVFAGQVQFLL